jgi:hypothetical protein
MILSFSARACDSRETIHLWKGAGPRPTTTAVEPTFRRHHPTLGREQGELLGADFIALGMCDSSRLFKTQPAVA